MGHEEVLSPVDDYRTRLRAAFANDLVAVFEGLFRQSGVDVGANRASVRAVRGLEAAIARLERGARGWQGARFALTLGAIALGAIALVWVAQEVMVEDFGVSRGVGVGAFFGVAGVLGAIFGWVNPRLRRCDAVIEARRRALRERQEAAWQTVAPLNRLFRWDTLAEIVMRTLPILAIDRYVSRARVRQLAGQFGWHVAPDEASSVVACQSGAINGNPWVIVDTLTQEWGTKRYEGTRVITWRERTTVAGPNGRPQTRWVVRTQTLRASVEKPIPVYRRHKKLVYGNEAAPDLHFSRVPNDLADADGFLDKLRLKRAIDKLEARSRDPGDPFTILDNRVFDACFAATDRDHEVQFRLLYTPLAQQETLNLLQDRTFGYGDDFTFVKHGMLNLLASDHLDALDIDAAPRHFRHYDLTTIRKRFLEYGVDFFRCLYFSFAPLLCIPLYQQHRNFRDVYAGVIDSGEADPLEHESLVNALDEACFRPKGADTRCILKVTLAAQTGEDALLTVVAHAFHGHAHKDVVSVLGGDGRWHDVPVPWVEYRPVSRTVTLPVCVAGTADPAACAAALGTPEWRARLRALKAGARAPFFRRGLVAFPKP